MRASTFIFSSTISWLFLGLLGIYLVDGNNFVGLRERFFEGEGPLGVWSSWFDTRSPTELFQWSALFGLSLISMRLLGEGKIPSERRFWLFVGLLAALALVEDSLDLRDQLAKTPLFSSLTATVLDFGVLSVIALFAVIWYALHREIRFSRRTLLLLLSGATIYAGVALLHEVQIQYWMGELIDKILVGGRIVGGGGSASAVADSVVEEGLELLAAGILLAGALSRREEIRSVPRPS